MWGAVIGDLAGSIYEYEQYQKCESINISNLISDNSFFSDDTILTIAILDAIINDKNYAKYLKLYGNKYYYYKPNVEKYFENPFSPGFMKWIKSDFYGNSIGNGAMMRISPVGYLFDTEEEVIENARLATIPSHNSKEAIECSKKISQIIFLARMQYSKDAIIKKLKIKLKYRRFSKFNSSCYETIDNCLYAVFTSDSFEESIHKILTYGGDTDTNACIVGAMAEALYGIDEIYINKAKEKIPLEFIEKLNAGYNFKENKKV
ncbi:MAG: ADP-ribosylglycohydrolase family protein [Bacilli bacterium]